MTKWMFIRGNRAVILDEENLVSPVQETVDLHEGKYVRLDDSPLRGIEAQYPQVCKWLARVGSTIVYSSPEQLADELGARLVPLSVGEEYETQIREVTALQSD